SAHPPESAKLPADHDGPGPSTKPNRPSLTPVSQGALLASTTTPERSPSGEHPRVPLLPSLSNSSMPTVVVGTIENRTFDGSDGRPESELSAVCRCGRLLPTRCAPERR